MWRFFAVFFVAGFRMELWAGWDFGSANHGRLTREGIWSGERESVCVGGSGDGGDGFAVGDE